MSTSSPLDTFVLDMGTGCQVAMSAALFCMMFAVALGLKVSDFSFIKKSPIYYFAGLFGQLALLPLLTLGVCFLFTPHPGVALGMLLIASCPGGNVSNILVLLSKGNTALSVSLTATSSLLAAFVTPTAILFWTSLYPPTQQLLNNIDLDVAQFLFQTSMILALPLILGMLSAHHFPKQADIVRKPLVIFASLLLIIIIVITVFQAGQLIITVGGAIVGVVALHNALAYLSGYSLGRLVGADKASRRALTIEVGIQNSGLGIVIIISQFGGVGAAAAVAGLWGVWHILAGILLVSFFSLLDKMYRK